MIDYGKLRFFAAEVTRSFRRNLVMQFTAVATVALMVLLLGAFLYARSAAVRVGESVLKQVEISVFFAPNLDDKSEAAIRAKIAADPAVRAVDYVPKKVGLAQLRRRLAGQVDTSLLTENPLPDALHVHVKRTQDVAAVATRIRAINGVATVEYAQDAVQKLLRLVDVLTKVGYGVIAALVVTSAIVISNTIRLTVFARRREIAIMRLVGASSAYVSGPFIVEGLIVGIAGSALAISALAIASAALVPKLAAAVPFLPLAGAAPSGLNIALELAGAGAAVGALASWFSVGRYLRA